MKENYAPTTEEFEQAEKIMTPEQAEASKIRERYHVQVLDPFDDFIENMDQDDGRRPATEKEKEQMDKNLITLGKIFKNCYTNWHLDGALNISLANRKYIGVHKDIDISIEKNELEKTETELEKNGYAFFLSHCDANGKNIMERINAQNSANDNLKHLMIAKINEQGKILTDEPLNFIDTHLVKRNEQGKPIGYAGVELPEEWFKAKPIDFKGEQINLSHPAKVAYFKVHSGRKYDQTDLYNFIEKNNLSFSDIKSVEKIFNDETKARENQVREIFGEVAEKIKDGMDKNQIFNIMLKNKIVNDAAQKNESQIKQLAEDISNNAKTKIDIINTAFNSLGINQLTEDIKTRIEELKKFKNIHDIL